MHPKGMDETGAETVWIDVLHGARFEVSSEDELFPMTHALEHGVTNGWRAASTGVQLLRLSFATPQRIKLVRVHAVDRVSERTQEMVLRAGASMEEMAEVARWEFQFSPGGSTEEVEECVVGLEAVTAVELRIDPDVRHGEGSEMYAALKSFWLA